jgi:hypothetical protein
METKPALRLLPLGLFAAIVGCDGTTSSAPTSTTTVAGRSALTSARVLATDAKGDTVATGTAVQGAFTIQIPEKTQFPLILQADSAGIKLGTFVPDTGAGSVEITPLTDSTLHLLVGKSMTPPTITTYQWNKKLDSLRPTGIDTSNYIHTLDSLKKAPLPAIDPAPSLNMDSLLKAKLSAGNSVPPPSLDTFKVKPVPPVATNPTTATSYDSLLKAKSSAGSPAPAPGYDSLLRAKLSSGTFVPAAGNVSLLNAKVSSGAGSTVDPRTLKIRPAPPVAPDSAATAGYDSLLKAKLSTGTSDPATGLDTFVVKPVPPVGSSQPAATKDPT